MILSVKLWFFLFCFGPGIPPLPLSLNLTVVLVSCIFYQLQADGKAMTEADLKDRCRALEQDLAVKKEVIFL